MIPLYLLSLYWSNSPSHSITLSVKQQWHKGKGVKGWGWALLFNLCLTPSWVSCIHQQQRECQRGEEISTVSTPTEVNAGAGQLFVTQKEINYCRTVQVLAWAFAGFFVVFVLVSRIQNLASVGIISCCPCSVFPRYWSPSFVESGSTANPSTDWDRDSSRQETVIWCTQSSALKSVSELYTGETKQPLQRWMVQHRNRISNVPSSSKQRTLVWGQYCRHFEPRR